MQAMMADEIPIKPIAALMLMPIIAPVLSDVELETLDRVDDGDAILVPLITFAVEGVELVDRMSVCSFGPESRSAGPALNTRSGSSQHAKGTPCDHQSSAAQQYVSDEQAETRYALDEAVLPTQPIHVSLETPQAKGC